MSGGVGPTCGDISLLPKEDGPPSQPSKSGSSGPSILTFRHLNCLAIITILSFSGTVSLQDISTLPLSLLYTHLLSALSFPSLRPTKADPPVYPNPSLLFTLYVSLAALLGLLLPVLYILHGLFQADHLGVRAASPHLFLLAAQVFMEGVAASRAFSIPVRAFVPLFFNSKRLFAIAEWVRREVGKEGAVLEGRVLVGTALAVANLGFWSFNLFGFLIPVYLPKALKMYYGSGGGGGGGGGGGEKSSSDEAKKE